jgi:hypothetical protein
MLTLWTKLLCSPPPEALMSAVPVQLMSLELCTTGLVFAAVCKAAAAAGFSGDL